MSNDKSPLPTENVIFALEQGEKVLESTLSSYDAIAGKAFTLFTIIVPLVAALIGYAVFHVATSLFWIALAYAGSLTWSGWYCWRIIAVGALIHPGREPLSYTREELEKDLPVLRERAVMQCQEGIDENHRKVWPRAALLQKAMSVFLGGTVLSLGMLIGAATKLLRYEIALGRGADCPGIWEVWTG